MTRIAGDRVAFDFGCGYALAMDAGSNDWAEKVENKIYNEQFKEISTKYGRKIADQANYGWGVDGSDRFVSVATKVYGVGVLETTARYPSMNVVHSWS